VRTERHAIVDAARERLLREDSPRAQMLVILLLSGAAAFLASVAMLSAGIERMAWRYPLALLVGYAAFLLLIRAWIAWKRRALHADPNLADVPLPSADHSDAALPNLFRGGRSGGGGGGAAWDQPPPTFAAAPPAPTAVSKIFDGASADFDDGAVLVILAALALGGALAISYIVYAAPALLAEVAVDAALVTTVYRRLRERDAPHWALSVVRRTWLPVLGLAALLMAGGFALQRAVPSARSIGHVLRALVG
jgi:hypothetical protein